MSTLCPYRIIKGDDGLSVKVEWDVHYLTDEQIGIVRKYVAEIKAENEKLRELVRGLHYCAKEAVGMCARIPVGGEKPFTCCPLYDFEGKECRCKKLMEELGVDV